MKDFRDYLEEVRSQISEESEAIEEMKKPNYAAAIGRAISIEQLIKGINRSMGDPNISKADKMQLKIAREMLQDKKISDEKKKQMIQKWKKENNFFSRLLQIPEIFKAAIKTAKKEEFLGP